MAKTIDSEERLARKEAYATIWIPHPRLALAKTRLRNLMDDTRAAIRRNDARLAENENVALLEHVWVMPLYGPSGATKSATLATAVSEINKAARKGPEDVPILVLTVRTSTKSPRFLQAQILEAYGCQSAEAVMRSRDYSEARVNSDIRRVAREHNTTVVVLDEAHNMIVKEGAAHTRAMAKALKSLLNDGVFSVVCAGTEDLRALFASDKELAGRMKTPLRFGRFEITSQADRDYFFGFVMEFEEAMCERGVIDHEIGLVENARNRALVYDMADGVIGSIPRLLDTALDLALEEGRGTIEWDDIAVAVQSRNQAATDDEDGDLPTYYDPFVRGARKQTLAILIEEEDEQQPAGTRRASKREQRPRA